MKIVKIVAPIYCLLLFGLCLFILHKLNNTIARNKTINIIPFLLIGTHHQEVYKTLKTKGVIVGNIDELFGDKYSESIYGIMNLMENAGAILKRNQINT